MAHSVERNPVDCIQLKKLGGKKEEQLLIFFCRTNWIKAVQMCSKAREFALALAILECAIKPVAMLPVWKDSLGHTRYTFININKAIGGFVYVVFSASSQREQIILSSNLKPNTLFFRLNRMTSMEREEKEKVKKREKKLEDEETLQQATWVKYTFPIKHQVYQASVHFVIFLLPCSYCLSQLSLRKLKPRLSFCHYTL